MSVREYFNGKLQEAGYELVEILSEDGDEYLEYHCMLRKGIDVGEYCVFCSVSHVEQETPTYSNVPTTNGSVLYEEKTPVIKIVTMHIFRSEKSIEYSRHATALYRLVTPEEKASTTPVDRP